MSFPKGEERKKGEGQRWPTTQVFVEQLLFFEWNLSPESEATLES